MEVSTSQYKHCDVVKPIGRIDSGTSPQLQEAMEAITHTGRYKIILDLTSVEYMSSAGLRVLIGVQKICKRYNRGEVVLASVPQRIYEALELAGFIPLFRFFDNLTDAVGNI